MFEIISYFNTALFFLGFFIAKYLTIRYQLMRSLARMALVFVVMFGTAFLYRYLLVTQDVLDNLYSSLFAPVLFFVYMRYLRTDLDPPPEVPREQRKLLKEYAIFPGSLVFMFILDWYFGFDSYDVISVHIFIIVYFLRSLLQDKLIFAHLHSRVNQMLLIFVVTTLISQWELHILASDVTPQGVTALLVFTVVCVLLGWMQTLLEEQRKEQLQKSKPNSAS